jgi:CcmD family protein
LLAAYAIVWLALFGYVWRLNSLQRGVQANLERLERSLGTERDRGAAPASAVSAH